MVRGGTPVSDLAQRAITAIIGATLVIAAMWVGGWLFAAVIGLAAVLAQREMYLLAAKGGASPLMGLGLVLGAVASLWAVLQWAFPVLTIGGLIVVLAMLVRVRETPLLDIAATLLGVFYPAMLAGFILSLRTIDWAGDAPFWLTVAVLSGVWGSDTFAYLAGRAFGKHPLFPRVSPKKTWEGAIGGLVGAIAIASAFKMLALDAEWTWLDVGVVAAACGVAGPLGDLAESLFKRSAGVKDSGSWLPGHGGMLDRIDAALVAVPLVALWFEWIR